MENVARCQNCDAQQVPGAQFCPSCGQSLSSGQQIETAFQKTVHVRKIVIRRIGVWSYAKVSTLFAAIFGVPILLITLIVLLVTGEGEALGWTLGFGVLYALGYLVMLAIFAWLFNLALRLAGGLELEVSD